VRSLLCLPAEGVAVPTDVDVSDAGSDGSMNRRKSARELGYGFDLYDCGRTPTLAVGNSDIRILDSSGYHELQYPTVEKFLFQGRKVLAIPLGDFQCHQSSESGRSGHSIGTVMTRMDLFCSTC
jgi:hypothetical protein